MSLTEKLYRAHTSLDPSRLIAPIFACSGSDLEKPLTSIEGQFCRSVDRLPNHLERLLGLGINEFLLFTVPDKRSPDSDYEAKNELVQAALSALKEKLPEAKLVVDICVCQSLTHGHCRVGPGIPGEEDRTSAALVKLSLAAAAAGADAVMPSAMLDGQVFAIRNAFSASGIRSCKIISQSAKSASALYGPFRASAHSGGAAISKADYQTPVANGGETLRELLSDLDEGADMVMVKPALTNLDALKEFKSLRPEPIAAFMTSGECALLRSGPVETVLPRAREAAAAALRAGADRVITYFAEELADFRR